MLRIAACALTTLMVSAAGLRGPLGCGVPAVGVNITSMSCATPGAALSFSFTRSTVFPQQGQFQLQGSGLCLSVNGTIPDDGSPAITFDNCDTSLSSPYQLFAFLLDRSIISAVNGQCLDLESGIVAPNERLETYSCNGGGNQHWTLNANGTLLSDFGFCVGFC